MRRQYKKLISGQRMESFKFRKEKMSSNPWPNEQKRKQIFQNLLQEDGT